MASRYAERESDLQGLRIGTTFSGVQVKRGRDARFGLWIQSPGKERRGAWRDVEGLLTRYGKYGMNKAVREVH